MSEKKQLTHIDQDGNSRMVDVLKNPNSKRIAGAEGFIRLGVDSIQVIMNGSGHKGNVLTVAQLAGIMGSKKTGELIPLCHPIPIDAVEVILTLKDGGVHIKATVGTIWKTGVEMEALTAVSVAALTVYDMLKAIDQGMVIEQIRLLEKVKIPI